MKIIIFILVVVFVMGFILLKKLNFIDVNNKTLHLYNGDNWANYRLGDVFYQDLQSRFYDSNFNDNVLYHKTKYPGTIANEYINKNKKNINYPLLKEIIESNSTTKTSKL